MKLLTNKLREYLEERHISQREFAQMLGIDHSTLSKLLSSGRKLGYEVAKKFVYQLGAYEASKFIDWEGMAIERPNF